MSSPRFLILPLLLDGLGQENCTYYLILMSKFNFSKPRWQHLLVLLLGMAFAMSAHADSYKLVLWQNNGNQIGSFNLKHNPKVTFSGSEVIVTTASADVYYYGLTDMWKFTYEKTTGINNILVDDNSVKINDDAIVFSALKRGSQITVYAVNGMLLMSKTVAEAGEYAFPISSLSQGVYMVNVDGETFKIVKK